MPDWSSNYGKRVQRDLDTRAAADQARRDAAREKSNKEAMDALNQRAQEASNSRNRQIAQGVAESAGKNIRANDKLIKSLNESDQQLNRERERLLLAKRGGGLSKDGQRKLDKINRDLRNNKRARAQAKNSTRENQARVKAKRKWL